ncbi:MAG TPA: helix-turn-helix domain-containing protein [Pirellulales bacterium]|nr:helix-turn-helix domain-containing protein [Pirellulales bacterium]
MEQHGRSAGDDELILALAAGATVREAAAQVGVSERTAYRRLADADFRRAVTEARERIFDAVRGRLAGLASKAAETLERLMESDKPAEALRAAKAVLELGPRLREATEREERVSRLEDAAAEENGSQTTADDDELVLALAGGATAREAAEQAGVGEPTAHLRLSDADFRRAVSRARGRIFDATLGRLAGLAGKAAGIFDRLMESDKPSEARRAAKAVLQLGPWLREATELRERINRLEDAADENTSGNPTPVIIDDASYADALT